jgi:3-oxoacyl-[acyl-carrier-protein] synthase-3
MIISSKGIKVIGSGAGLPLSLKSNHELFPETDEWVKSTLGISQRGILGESESLLELCIQAANEALGEAGISGKDLDAIIVATSTPDFTNPSMAVLVHDAIDGKPECMSLDIQAVCAGFIHALAITSSLNSAGAGKYYLLIGADQFSKITNFESRDCVFFGDAASAMLLESTDDSNRFSVEVFSEGSGWESFYTSRSEGTFRMNSKEVSKNATLKLPDSIRNICKYLEIQVEDISQFFTHQPSKGVLNKLLDTLKIPEEKAFRNIENRGNTAAATIPLVFYESQQKGKLKPGEFACFSAIGSGWVWGSAILEWAK